MSASDKIDFSDLREDKNTSGHWPSIIGAAFVIVASMSVAIVPFFIYGSSCSNNNYVPEDPCHDQLPPECIAETVEQASSSQFAHYVYCGCMTVDGTALGYVAADSYMTKSLRENAVDSKSR